jgi:molybdopterin-guanine dinucleotide biosynthesis protein A
VPKGLIRFEGVPLVERLRRLAWGPVLVSTNQPELYEWLDVPLVGDAFGARGAPGGVVTSLFAAPTDWVLVVGCDMPFLTRELLSLLVDRARPSIDVVAFERAGEVEPLAALYRRELAADWAPRLEGNPSLRALIDSVRWETVTPTEPWRLSSLNSPQDFETFRRLAASGTVASPPW